MAGHMSGRKRKAGKKMTAEQKSSAREKKETAEKEVEESGVFKFLSKKKKRKRTALADNG